MKTNNKIIVKITAIVLLGAMIVTFTQCAPKAKEIGTGSSYHAPAKKSEGQVLNELQVEVGVKNFEQILYTMEAVTGIDARNNNSIMDVYEDVSSSLPTDNNIKIYSATQQVAVTKLAAEFCYQLTRNDYADQRGRVWPGLNLNSASGSAFNQANEERFINQTIDAFWGGVLSDEERESAISELQALIELIINNDNTTAATQRTVRGACTAALSSAYIIIL